MDVAIPHNIFDFRMPRDQITDVPNRVTVKEQVDIRVKENYVSIRHLSASPGAG